MHFAVPRFGMRRHTTKPLPRRSDRGQWMKMEGFVGHACYYVRVTSPSEHRHDGLLRFCIACRSGEALIKKGGSISSRNRGLPMQSEKRIMEPFQSAFATTCDSENSAQPVCCRCSAAVQLSNGDAFSAVAPDMDCPMAIRGGPRCRAVPCIGRYLRQSGQGSQ